MDKKQRLEFLKSVVALTKAKLTTGKIDTEYSQVELTGPAPGCAWDQHTAMVTRGLCKAAEENVERNRYSNLYPYDAKRVVLQPLATDETEDETDYINASWIEVLGVNIKFILTMAPLHPASFSSSRRTDFSSSSSVSTCPEFWRMVHQTSASRILMICKLEAGYAGCSQYFPDSTASPHTHGAYTVTLHSAGEQNNPAIIENKFRLAWKDGERIIEHLQFPFWPNYGVVQNLADLAALVEKVYELVKESREPLIVHCSGGIGRSGTFTTILSAYTLIRDFLQTGDKGKLESILADDGAITLQKIVTSLREQRHPWMVEGEHQYLLAYSTLIYICDQLLDSVSDA